MYGLKIFANMKGCTKDTENRTSGGNGISSHIEEGWTLEIDMIKCLIVLVLGMGS
jgi:hypothetical protein